ncbi:unnamed protein product [Rotaria sordida]|uniref:Uncharacterized protein n=1 Tax=Rotaria sordida TaxID=392033 RepID=A0A818RFV5_9BILA|nr:unnamed protein product [Rotaria sordida]CAF1195175.1 unnamed protein product [Rotaria sordida]CAF1344383.1 unnamed protein product [Rotaria sordida]CAF3653213.1 unnamed protein product [Rotaria sordida]
MLWYALVITLLLVVRNGQSAKTKTICKNDDIYAISSGTSFGECLEYCRHSINITNVTSELVALKESNGDQVKYPTIRRKFCFNSVEWQELIALLDLEKFKMLNEVQGCPDCADGGAEWIEVNWSKKSKRVTFEHEALVAGIEELIKYLRVLREKYFKYL